MSSAVSDDPCSLLRSSPTRCGSSVSGMFLTLYVPSSEPGGSACTEQTEVLVIKGVASQTAAEDADESVGEGAEDPVVGRAGVTLSVNRRRGHPVSL